MTEVLDPPAQPEIDFDEFADEEIATEAFVAEEAKNRQTKLVRVIVITLLLLVFGFVLAEGWMHREALAFIKFDRGNESLLEAKVNLLERRLSDLEKQNKQPATLLKAKPVHVEMMPVIATRHLPKLVEPTPAIKVATVVPRRTKQAKSASLKQSTMPADIAVLWQKLRANHPRPLKR